MPGVKSKTQLGITAPSSSLIAYALSTCTSCETKRKLKGCKVSKSELYQISEIIIHPQKSLLGRRAYHCRCISKKCLGMNSLKTLLIWLNAFLGSLFDKQEPIRLFIYGMLKLIFWLKLSFNCFKCANQYSCIFCCQSEAEYLHGTGQLARADTVLINLQSAC